MLDYLPQPILFEILHRLPANFLVKCMSISKTWYSIIKSAEFIDAHSKSSISRNTKDAHLVRLIRNGDTSFSLHFESIESHEYFHKRLNIPWLFTHHNTVMIGYSNGIVCYAISEVFHGRNNYYWYCLWNPSIQKCFILPQPHFEGHFRAAFVFDSNANDFKVIAVDEVFNVELYSLRNNSWKVINLSDPHNVRIVDVSHIFMNGVIYFLGYDLDDETNELYLLLGFNMADEVFHKILLPKGIQDSDSKSLIQYGDTSIAIVGYYGDGIGLWVMEEVSASGTWKEVLVDLLPDSFSSIFGVWKGSLLFATLFGKVTSLDLNTQQWKEVGLVQRVWTTYNSIHRYEETLILLDKGGDLSILDRELFVTVDNSSDEDDHA